MGGVGGQFSRNLNSSENRFTVLHVPSHQSPGASFMAFPTERSLEIKLVSYLNGPVPERAISANLQFKFQAMIALTFLFTSLETRRELGRVNFR